jgi:hypothetical protein
LEFAPHQSYFVIFESAKPKKPAIAEVNFPKASPLVTLQGPWQVSFDPKFGGPQKVTFDNLYDWTKSENDGIKYYSGIAVYKKTFDADSVSGKRVYLDLGKVHEIARVKLNGKDLGVVWCAPWRIDITDALKSGTNALEIEVANLWPNRLIGDDGKPQEQRFTWTILKHPYKAESQLLPSGLLGPVQLITVSKKELLK